MSHDRPLDLDSSDLTSSTWLKIKGQLEKRLQKAREKNDGEALSPTDTAILRGEIKALKAFLRLGQEKPPAIDG